MTRKCILCKETNYKNSYSFFSAPKDAEMRKKWQEAIGIENYVVNDETFVCSRHFTPGDIITHWVSGVPPHVVTIKYKKCRLRPGAIPSTSIDIIHDNNEEDDFDNFDVNRQWGGIQRQQSSSDNNEVFLIPRADNILTYTAMDSQNSSMHIKTDDNTNGNAEIAEYLTKTMKQDGGEVQPFEDESTDNMILSEQEHEEFEALQGDMDDDGNAIYLKSNDESIIYVDDLNFQSESLDPDMNDMFDSKEGIPAGVSANDKNNEIEDVEELEEEDTLEMWDGKVETISNDGSDGKPSRTCEDMSIEILDPLDAGDDSEDVMLFEDLLEVYTEVQLPRSWSSMVISAGRSTTVVYARMTMGMSNVPYIQKQVFLKSDMTLQCSTMGTTLNPRLHNLVREGRQLKVHTLLDVEAMIEEFDQRTVCEGAQDIISPTDLDCTVAYRHDSRWRHVDCPIIINNGSSCCSKCSTLNLCRRKLKKPPQTAESAELLKKERTIYVLQKLLAKMSKRNQRYESMRDSPKSILDTLDSLDMPEIQKLMIQECLKGDSDETTTNIKETWIFLSLLIYIESPRMYKFLLLNKYMNLPDIKVMRRYLHQIKTDDQFYKLFQRTVEPFQYSELEDEKEPT